MKKKTICLSKNMIKFIIVFFVCFCAFPLTANAESGYTEIEGKLYKFKKGDPYSIKKDSEYTSTDESETYGIFGIKGNVVLNDNEQKFPTYEVSDDKLEFFYNYGDSKLNAGKDKWHLVEDNEKKVSNIELKSKISKGVIVIQTSKDRKNWVDETIISNAFEKSPIRTKAIYTAKDVQLLNGCYYRITVAYKLAIRDKKDKFLFINTDKYKYKKQAEVYEFYVKSKDTENTTENPEQVYALGTKQRVKHHDGYFGKDTISKTDIHYGWDLGDFFITGYTYETTDIDGKTVFLKNIDDKVTLWFRLKHDIDAINECEDLSITSDTEGYDQYFETPRINFGRGALIIRHTDCNNIKSDPVIYTNYLEANVTVNADTKVQLFDEGDYEVALDYEVTSDKFIDKVGHYRIFFEFSVRNGNCMVYSFDTATGSELSNGSSTENGFRLDLAKSRYLKINLKREILKDTADCLIEDTRFNGPAMDGAEYTDEGIYTITVDNEYTGQSTTKKIYVGTNDILRAYVTTGLTISEINTLIAKGAMISEDGNVQLATSATAQESENNIDDSETDVIRNQNGNVLTVSIIIAVVICITILSVILKKKRIDKESKGGKKE